MVAAAFGTAYQTRVLLHLEHEFYLTAQKVALVLGFALVAWVVAALWLGIYELGSRPELPYRVALAEAVQLAKQFGATDGHKFVNAVLDRAARELRPHEYGRPAE